MELLNECRFCSQALQELINFDGINFPLAGGFMRNVEEFADEKVFPLSLSFCSNCVILQCRQIIDSDILFKKGYFYYSSMLPALVSHFEEYAKKLSEEVPDPTRCLVVEMGCNDGVFLRPLKKRGFNVIGIDPSDTVLGCIRDGFSIYNTYLTEELASNIVSTHGQCDIFLSSNSFAHINNMKSVLNSIKILLKEGGLAVIEVHYSKTIIDELQFDFIYHEHMSYYTATSMSKIFKLYGMSLEKIEFTEIHGKSMRVYVRNTPLLKFPQEVANVIDDEKDLSIPDTYKIFWNRLSTWKDDITLILQTTFEGKKIYGYGSSGRSNIICNFLNLKLDEIIDDAPSKIGSYTPVHHLKIKSSSIIQESPPDLIIILSWTYSSAIIEKLKGFYHGLCLIPLPTIQIINT